MIGKLKRLLIFAGLIFSSLLVYPLSALAEDQSTSHLDSTYAEQIYRFNDSELSYTQQSAEKIHERKTALEDLQDNLKNQMSEKKNSLKTRQENLKAISSRQSDSSAIAINELSSAQDMDLFLDNISDYSNGRMRAKDNLATPARNISGNAANETKDISTAQPSVGAISAAIDQQLLYSLDSLAECYWNSKWNISLEQYKAWMATIAWSEGGIAGYSAHSQAAPGSDLFYHIDAGEDFTFSTGIGPFQIDNGYDNWEHWPTIDKLNYQMALKSALKFHSTFGEKTPSGEKMNLEYFSKNSRWYGVRPNKPPNQASVADLWNAVTGTSWDENKAAKCELDWDGIKNNLILNAQDPSHDDLSYDHQVAYQGYIQWNILESDKKFTDLPQSKQIIFDGEFPTWKITARYLDYNLYSYYYTYNPEIKLEVWAWEDPTYTYKYIFVRDYSTDQYPENVTNLKGGFTLTHPAIFSLKECRWDGKAGVITSRPYSLKDSQGKNHFFVRGGDSGLWDNEDGTWKGLGGVITSAPCAVMDKMGTVHIFARGSDGALWERILGGGWTRHTASIAPNSNPDSALSPEGHIKVAIRFIDNTLHVMDVSTGEWSSLGGIITSNPQIIYDSQGKMHVFVKGGDGALWDSADGWKCQGGIITSDPKPILNPFKSGFINTYVRGGDGALWVNELNTNQGTATWKGLGGFIKSNGGAPFQAASETGIIEGNPDSVVDADGVIHTFICGGDGSLWDNINGTWYCLGGGLLSDPNVMRDKDGRINIAVSGTDTALWINTFGLNQVPITLVGPIACDYTRIQDAVDASPSGGLIKVLSGTYKENVQTTKSLIIVGDGMGKTIVDGGHAGSVFSLGSDATLRGMTIMNGNATSGGGIFSQGKLDLIDCLIAGNLAASSTIGQGHGGGILNFNTLNLSKCYIFQNTANKCGGGIYSVGKINMDNVIIINNTANYEGGGIFNGGELNLDNSLILINKAKTEGGGIWNGGAVMMNNGSIIFGNNATTRDDDYRGGGGVLNLGTFTMNDGTILGNSAGSGGGVKNAGEFTINAGTISENSATKQEWQGEGGGGIHNSNILTVNGGDISTNKAIGSGGGIYNNWGTFIMNGGNISGNEATNGVGSGIFTRALFTMNGGTVSANNGRAGSGVALWGGNYTMNGGIISGNNATSGGGIYCGSTDGIFMMNGGAISENSATSGNGGGIRSIGAITMNGGIISGNTANQNGGGICHQWDISPLFIGGDSQIINNQATAGYGGGIYSTTGYNGSVTFDGSMAAINSNRAHLPSPSELDWYQGWGVYQDKGIPTATNGFDPTTQVTDNNFI